MSKKLDFSVIDEAVNSPEPKKSRVPRWKSREPNPTVQMSLRMKASKYEEFRNLCEDERRTNGDMVEVLMDHYKASQK